MVRKIAFSFVSANPDKLTGLSSYTESLVKAVSKAGVDVEFFTNADRKIFPSLEGRASIKFRGLFGRRRIPFKIYAPVVHLYAAFKAKLSGADAIVSCTPQGPLLPILPFYSVIHDMYDVDPSFKSKFHVLYSKLYMKFNSYFSAGHIAVSDNTKKEAFSIIGSCEGKLSVIKEASKYEVVLFPLARENRKKNTFLFVANVEPTKNVRCILNALLLAARNGSPIEVRWVGRDASGDIRKWLSENSIDSLPNFIPLGRLTDQELAAEYASAQALIVSSFKEGFCLPVLEAHAFGTPVIASSIPIMNEVVGSAGVFFDPSSPEECLNQMLRIAQDEDLFSTLQEYALENARKYSWGKAASELIQFVYRDNRWQSETHS